LLGDENVSVRQNQQAPWIGKPRRKSRSGKAPRHLRRLSVIRNHQRPVGDDGPGLRRGQIVRINAKPVSDLMLDEKILRRIGSCLPFIRTGCTKQ
jgi:hypothetical protein